MKAIRGQAGQATVLIGSVIVLFIFAIIALALTPSLATSASGAIAGGNVSASNAAAQVAVTPMVQLTTTIWAVIIILTLLGALGAGFMLSRK